MKTWADFDIQVPAGHSGELDTTCPQCSPMRKKKRAKCLSVNADKGTWLCHHCGWVGGLSSGEERKGTAEHWYKPNYRKPERPSDSALPSRVVDWFSSRSISFQVLERNGVYSRRVYMPQAEETVQAICFPYYRDGELVNVKYRDGAKNFRMEAGAERILYGLDDIDAAQVVIVEGEIDKLSVEMAGFKSCLSVPDGAPSPNTKDYTSKFDFLESAKPLLDGVKKFVIAVDNDEPGKRLEAELVRRLDPGRCLCVNWPEGCKDANETLCQHGTKIIKDAIENAEPYPVAGIFEVRDISERIDALYEYGFRRGLRTGWLCVDNLYTVRPGEWTVVTGVPGHGKSNWLDHLCVNLAEMHGLNIGMFSPENQPIERHAARLMAKYARVPFDNGPTPRMSATTKDDVKRWVGNHFSWILPDDDEDWSIGRVLELAKTLVYRRGIQALVIDPWNELDHSRPSAMTETEYISKALTGIRRFARLHEVHVFLVAHPTKLRRDANGDFPIPNPYDISGSAHWRNKADNCVTVWRNTEDPKQPVEVHVQKIRFDEIGRLGVAKLSYDRPSGRYDELTEPGEYRRIK